MAASSLLRPLASDGLSRGWSRMLASKSGMVIVPPHAQLTT